MRKRLYTIVEQGRDNDWVSYIYDFVILAAITASIIPLMFIETYPIFTIIEDITVGLLILDYLLRWIVADYIVGKGNSEYHVCSGFCVSSNSYATPRTSRSWAT